MVNQSKFVFFGTPEFAAIVLEKLIVSGFAPTALICNPDRPVGRKKIVTSPPTKLLANKHNIQVLQPENLSSLFSSPRSSFGGAGLLSSLEADFAIVAAYAKIIPKEIINLFPRGIVGVHPSLLPKYRGTSPIQTAILNGEKETGITLYLIDELVDHGPILAQQKLGFSISGFQFPKLLEELAKLSGDFLVKTLPDFVSGKIKPQTQNETEATYTKKFKTDDAFIAPEKLKSAISGENRKGAEEIDRKIRALNPEPGTWTMENEKRIKLLGSKIDNNCLVLTITQKEGEKPKKA